MSEIEPVTERDIDEVLNARAAGYDIRYALEQDRRRVAERRVGRQSDYNPTSPSHEAANAELARIASVIDDAREIERLRAESALSTDAGKGWIDATGAVEATVQHIGANQGVPECFHVSATVPDDWAGSRVLIIPKPDAK